MSGTVLDVAGGIVPDDKNWTWVLERRCGECGFDAPSFDVSRSSDAVRDQVARWRSVLGGAAVKVRPRPGVWSPLEYGCHVRDVFLRFDERIRRMIDEVDPRFENWDQDATAVEERYDLQDPRRVADEIDAAGTALAARLGAVEDGQWSRRGFRSDGSVFTIESITRYLIHDPVHHLWDVGADVPSY